MLGLQGGPVRSGGGRHDPRTSGCGRGGTVRPRLLLCEFRRAAGAARPRRSRRAAAMAALLRACRPDAGQPRDGRLLPRAGRLVVAGAGRAGAESRALIERWGLLHAGRTVLGVLATAIFLWATMAAR